MTDEQEQIRIDRMVDGELSQDQQRELLLDCEREARWRELALAYVEAQAWKRDLAGWPQPTTDLESPKRTTATSSWDLSSYSLAAAILLSLGLGYGLGWGWQSNAVGPQQVVNQTNLLESDANGSPAAANRLQLVLADPTTNGLRHVELPVVNASELDSDWLDRWKSDIPDSLLQDIHRGGLDVERTRMLTPVQLQDGRRVLLPVEYYIERDFQ